jgi:hypothetical protein
LDWYHGLRTEAFGRSDALSPTFSIWKSGQATWPHLARQSCSLERDKT